MGCCLSRAGGEKRRRRNSDDREPPPPTSPLEEETVKEIFMETPILPKAASVNGRSDELKVEIESTAEINHNPNPRKEPIEEKEISEICSNFSESFSNTTATERNDDVEAGEVNQKLPTRKVRQPQSGVRRRTPTRRTVEPSQEKRLQVGPPPLRGQRRNVEAEKVRRRRDAGEGSRRRSRSPPTRGETSENGGGKNEAADGVVLGNVEAESLENPVVSLECFIFL